jgi:dTDP-4-dehydrorhamnose reductase
MWLLVGGDSEIGAATQQFLDTCGVVCVATTRRKDQVSARRPLLDLAAPIDHWQPPAGTTAACIFAAVAHVAACAADPQGSAYVNVTKTVALVKRLLKLNISVLYLSTNQVFDGSIPRTPATTRHSPVSEYGRQKSQAEKVFLASMNEGAPLAILRLAKVVRPAMPLIRGWIDALRSGQSIRAFADMRLAPVEIAVASNAIAAIMQNGQRGIFQLSGPRDLSYLEVAQYVARKLAIDPSLVVASTTSAAGLPIGSAPRHTTLDSSHLRDDYGIAAGDVLEVIDTIIYATQ